MDATKIRLYGIPIASVHDKSLGPILESNEKYPYVGIIYCGYALGAQEVRIPTGRLWYFGKSAIAATGEVKDFNFDGKQVHYYDIDLKTDVQEKMFRPVSLGAEFSSPRIFAGKVATSPQGGMIPAEIAGLTPEQHEARVALMMSGGRQVMRPIAEDECKTWYQTYEATRYDPFVMRDPWGADCD